MHSDVLWKARTLNRRSAKRNSCSFDEDHKLFTSCSIAMTVHRVSGNICNSQDETVNYFWTKTSKLSPVLFSYHCSPSALWISRSFSPFRESLAESAHDIPSWITFYIQLDYIGEILSGRYYKISVFRWKVTIEAILLSLEISFNMTYGFVR